MGERGPGPAAPSALSAERHRPDDPHAARLSWRDNSSDELGFVIQGSRSTVNRGVQSFRRWSRVTHVPADTASVNVDVTPRYYRVFAYNERGYSLSSRVYIPPQGAAGTCEADAETLCLRNSRFEVAGGWRTEGYRRQGGFLVVDESAGDSGMFYLFDPDNWEFLVKVLDGCATNGKMWVLGASTTDLGYYIRVTDTVTRESKVYENEFGRPAPAIVDTEAFSLACDAAIAGR